MPFKSDSIYFPGEARSSMYMCYLLYTTKLSSFFFIFIYYYYFFFLPGISSSYLSIFMYFEISFRRIQQIFYVLINR